MRIVVIGGSRGTGRALAALAVARGHEVVAASRSGTGPDGASAVAVDAADAEALRPMLRGADAVAVTVGPTKGAERARTAVTRAVVAAMEAEGVRRIVVQSSTGVGSSIEHLPALLRPVMRKLLDDALADHLEQEEAVRASGLAWTIVRPTGLKNGSAEGKVVTVLEGEKGTVKGSITRERLAVWMLDALADDALVGSAVSISAV